MSDKNKFSDQEILLAEIVMKLAAIERLLVRNNLISDEALKTEIKTVSDEVIKAMKSQAQPAGN